MELRKALKGIVALGTGATMVGATVLSALAAADLANYPAPFVSGGQFDALIVVGANAKTDDVLGSIDIATSLQAANTVTKALPGGSSSVTVEGDAFRLDSGSDFLELDELIDDVGITTLTSEELAALAGGSVSNSKGTSQYEERITVAESASVSYEVDPDDSSDIPSWYLLFTNTDDVYVYQATFTPAIKSDIASGEHEDLEDMAFTLLGKEYTVFDADLQGADSWQIDLMGGAAKDVIGIGETKTYSIGDKDYEVTLAFVDGTNAKFTVNGKSTKLIASGGTEVLADSTEIGVKELLYQGDAGGVQSVEFFLGASKIRLEDTDTSDDALGGASVIVGSNTVTDVTAQISGTNTTTERSLNYFTLTWVADEDIYVPVDGKLSGKEDDDQVFLNFEIEFKGISEHSSKDEIVLKPRGDDEYDFDFTNKAGNLLSVPLYDVDPTDTIFYGNENYGLVVAEGDVTGVSNWTANVISVNDYFVVSDSAGKNTYLLRYKDADATENTLEFEEVGSGSTVTVSYTWVDYQTAVGGGGLNLGGTSYPIYLQADSNNADIIVDLDLGGISNGTVPTWFTKYGAEIVVDSSPSGDFTVTREDTDDAAAGEDIDVTVSADSDEIDVATVGGAVSLVTYGDTDDSVDYGVWGTKVFLADSSSGPDKLTITSPDEQTEQLVFYTSGATTSSVSGGAGTYQEIVPISVGAAVLDTEVADFSAQNLIVVGGPCVNAAASDLLGDPADCTEGFEEGKAMVKLFERANGNVALLVAGYSALDTRRAARAVANYGDYAFSGAEVEVSGTSLTQITVSAPSVMESAPSVMS